MERQTYPIFFATEKEIKQIPATRPSNVQLYFAQTIQFEFGKIL
jgi:hypothetical protein